MGLLLLAMLASLYFLPSIIGRQKRNFGAIFALNLLLGWTLIGWVVSLMWALTKENVDPVVVQQRSSSLLEPAQAAGAL